MENITKKIYLLKDVFFEGCDRFRKDVLKIHAEISDHSEAIEDAITEKVTQNLIKKMILNNEQKYNALMKIVYYPLKNSKKCMIYLY